MQKQSNIKKKLPAASPISQPRTPLLGTETKRKAKFPFILNMLKTRARKQNPDDKVRPTPPRKTHPWRR